MNEEIYFEEQDDLIEYERYLEYKCMLEEQKNPCFEKDCKEEEDCDDLPF